jgi:hypothetical protein
MRLAAGRDRLRLNDLVVRVGSLDSRSASHPDVPAAVVDSFSVDLDTRLVEVDPAVGLDPRQKGG